MAIIGPHISKDGKKTYYVDFRDQLGKRRTEVGGTTVRAARAKEKDILRRVDAGTYVHPRDRKKIAAQQQAQQIAEAGPLFSDFVNTFATDRRVRKANRSDHYTPVLARLDKAFGAKRLREITPADVDAFAIERAGEVGPATLRRDLTGLKTMLRLARRQRLITENPAETVEMPSLPEPKTRFLTRDEYHAFEAKTPARFRPMFRFAVATGLRLKELCEARWSDYDEKNGHLTLTGNNKTRSTRTVPVGAAGVQVLKDLAATSLARRKEAARATGKMPPAEVHIFLGDDGEPYGTDKKRTYVSGVARDAARAAKLAGVSFHTLRHTFASWAVQQGRPLYEVQTQLGHCTPTLTQRYAQFAPGHLAATVDAVSAVLNGGMVEESPAATHATQNAAESSSAASRVGSAG